ncbi:DUF6414 family protein [Phytoactinopolyspora limicola]|uniref:DUF6414 family protein n=1 Tax=Phytoactinopolyspora limicola TaxID=2715536 RepID=UPI00140E2667|nr:hypothetical protein [Phytoactinopolyspora limicola]
MRLRQRWRRKRTWEQRRREFVYLDEVSVTSLVAARHGSIAETFKNTHSETAGIEAGSQLSTPLTPGLSLNSRTTSSKTTTQEVVRRAVVQGTFRSLRITDSDLKLSIEDQQPQKRPRQAKTEAELVRALEKLTKQRRAVRVSDLKRGDVVELRVELSADRTYQFTAAATSMLDMIKGRSSVFGISEFQLAEIAPMLDLLPKMLVDLVPINANVTSHVQLDLENESWLIDTTMIAPESPLVTLSEPISVAGVTELPLYWKDARRVLFDRSEYIVYARLARSGLDTAWSPVKIADVFDSISKDIGDQIRQLPLAFEGVHKAGVEVLATPIPDVLKTHGLIPFGQILARATGRELDDSALEQAAHEAAQGVADIEKLGDVRVTRAAFDRVVAAVESSAPLVLAPIDRDLVAELREPFQNLARVLAALPVVEAAAVENSAEDDSKQQLLEVEFVAIYW